MKLSDIVSVRLTERGYEIYNTFCFRRFQANAPELESYEFSLEVLMQIFGSHMFEGCLPLFIDDTVRCFNE